MQVMMKEVQPGDAITVPGIGNLMVRNTKHLDATERTRIEHVIVTCAIGRTDDGFDLTFPGLMTLHAYRDGEL